jgi:hypothetical protein
MQHRTMKEWITWYERKTGEKFESFPGYSFEFYPDKGFLFWKQDRETFMIGPAVTTDWIFWRNWAMYKAKKLGCKLGRTFTRRNDVAFVRLTGGLAKRGIDENGKKVALIEWKVN